MGISLRSIFVELSLRQLVSERVPFAMVIVVAMGFEMLRLFRGSSLGSEPVTGPVIPDWKSEPILSGLWDRDPDLLEPDEYLTENDII